MDELTTAPEMAPATPPPSALPDLPPTQDKRYEGNSFDLYALIAGIVGVTSLVMCFSGNMMIYCLPFVPLVFGIIALRNSARALNPSRTRTMGWIGVAAGVFGVLVLVLFAVVMMVYFVFIATIMGSVFQNLPRRP